MTQLQLPGTTNKITNPSWELSESGWQEGATSILTTSYDYSRTSLLSWVGSYSGSISVSANTAASGNAVYLKTNYDIELDPGDVYQAQVRARVTNVNFKPFLTVEFLNASNVVVGSIAEPVVAHSSTTGWVWHKLETIVPVGATKAVVYLGAQFGTSSLNNVTVYFDGAQYEWSDEVTTYCDGDQPGCYWQGAEHLSRSTRDAKYVPRGSVGRFGVIKIQPELYIANKHGQLQTNITDWVHNGQVSLDTERDIHMDFSADIRYPDRLVPFVDHLAPFLTVVYADGTAVRDQIGLFVVLPPNKEHTYLETIGRIEGLDITWWVSQQAYDKTFKLSVGDVYTTVMKNILVSCGITRYSISPSTKTCTEVKTWPAGTSKLAIFNELAAAINYHPLHASRTGELRSFAFIDINKAQPVGKYRGGDNGVVIEPFSVQPSTEKLANVIIVLKESTESTPSTVIKAVRRNTNPASPTSSVSLGGEIIKVVADSSIETQGDADALADKMMLEWSSLYVKATLHTFPEPWHNPYEVYDVLLYNRNNQRLADADGFFLCTGWRLGFSTEDATMEHDIFRIVPYSSEVT